MSVCVSVCLCVRIRIFSDFLGFYWPLIGREDIVLFGASDWPRILFSDFFGYTRKRPSEVKFWLPPLFGGRRDLLKGYSDQFISTDEGKL